MGAATVAQAAPPGAEVPTTAATSWQARPEVVADCEQRGESWIFRESRVPSYTLPDPLLCADGTRVSSVQQWEQKRRPETLELFRNYVYGRSPEAPQGTRFEVVEEDHQAVGGQAMRRRVRISVPIPNGGFYSFEASVLIPNARRGPAPAFLLINNRSSKVADPTRQQKDDYWPAEELIARGYATAVFLNKDVQADEAEGLSSGVVAAMGASLPRGGDAWATIAAWSWGASRVMDYLQTVPEIDASKVAVVGHSRGGKTALWAGAQDTRFALVISNDSGCMGAAISRRRFGETVEAINTRFPHWFCSNLKAFNAREDELPVDQHQLIALMAPRAVYVASADQDLWADQRGEFLSLVHAGPVYALYGQEPLGAGEMPPLDRPIVRGRMGYHIRSGIHNLTLVDWRHYMDFADQLWGR